ncbi:serine/threonine-protein phosphatase 4 regulatory subunit 1-like isoform X2 [Chrysoperla carnea]|uniref:serine/threonine-protein phosphatase 4 regulatory subunit 1-like isoform X2 n=1 Tax=Chrysoperla carnea TaxID=189513 RepID=UPI001D08104E|nr:serine/threonine-protein phosphatase 4 regulatory subunit 1-like isoform X2 [Chrysoperla carnea]
MADVSNYIEEYDEGGRDNGDGDEMLESNVHSVAGDDSNLRPLEQLQKCVISEHAWNRPMVGGVLLQVMRDFSANGGAYLKDLPAIMNLVEGILNADTTLVKTDLIEQIPQLAVVCMESNIPEMTETVEKYLLPLVVNCFKDTDTQVRKTSQATLLVLMEHNLVSKHTVELKVCPTVLEISRDYVNSSEELTNAEDYVAGAINFMSKLAPLLGKDATERLFLNRFSELCSYDRFSVRKMCAASIGEFCAVVGSEAYEKILLPRFIGLCDDDIWGVRKYCAEVIMSVSCACPPHLRRTALAPAFERLLDDTSRWVRISAFQNLGPFISTFANPRITGLAYSQTGELVIINPKGTEFRENEELSPNHSSGGGDKSSPMEIDEEVSEIVIIENTEKSTAPSPTMILVNGADDQTNNTVEELSPPQPPVPSIVINQEESKEEWLKPRNKNKERRRNKKTHKELILKKKLVQINLDSENALTNDVNALTNDLSTLNLSETTNTTDIVPNINSQDEQDDNNKSESPPPPPRPPSEPEPTSDDIEKINNFSDNVKIENIDESSNNSSDDLEKYNSHQFWYISPELPLDMDIVEAGRKTSTSFTQECTTTNVLDDHNIMLDSTIPMTITSTSSDNESVDRGVKLYSEILKHNTSIPTIRHLESPKQHIVPQLLIEHYTSMTDPVLASLTDAELSYHCAFSFPAVALTLGKDHWDLLHKTYITLAADIQWKVRRAVAGSLHEVATILGEKLATEHLAPIFDDLIKDVDVVRIGALKHMAYFFKIIAPHRRNQYLPRLAEFLVTDSALNWRYRCELANQLLLSLPLWTGRDVGRHILPLAKELLQDKVAAVRAAAVLLVSDLIHHVESESLNKRAFPNVAQIFNVHFAHSKSWVRRQTFATLCAKLVTQYVLPPETFARDVMPHFLDLSWDPVANVRLAVAKTLANNILKNEYFADPNCIHNEPLLKVLRRLQSDKDRDVRQAASTIF